MPLATAAWASAVYAFLFSIISLYLLTAVMVMWKPDTDYEGSSRITSSIVANSTLLALAGLLASARFLSSIGDILVDLVVSVVESNPASSTKPKSAVSNRLRMRAFDDL